MRILLNFLGMWAMFTLAIHWLVEASGRERISVAKAVGFGFGTAVLTALLLFAVVVLF